MYIKPGITLRHRSTGEHFKITAVHAEGVVRVLNEENKAESNYSPQGLREFFEEFGPLYEIPLIGAAHWPEVELSRCPFCGSTHLDASAWASEDKHGPGCMDCGATAETPESWNQRPGV